VSRQPAVAAELFDAQRLRIARCLRGIPRNQLARSIGVSAAAVSQYELGQTRPRSAVVSKLALTLGVPASFFAAGRQTTDVRDVGAHFRSLRSTTQRDRDRARAFVALLWEVTQQIERYVGLPTYVGMTQLSERAPEQAAQALRRAWSVPDGPIADVVRLLESRGIVVTYSADIARTISAFSAPLTPRPVVVLDPSHDRARQRFDVAHELAHLVLHPEPDPGLVAEEEAHRFAAEFLAPAAEIERQLPPTANLRSYLHLKLHWGMSIHALLMRARRLGVLSDASYRRGMRKLATTYGRRDEPAPLGPPEQPVLLRTAVGLLYNNGISVTAIADALCLPESFTRQLLGLDPPDTKPTVSSHDLLAVKDA
jgi:Zn-dependent peptidase ImmA (M78 family)/DNA-binding XRE family transcriptional regulator